LKMMTLSAKSLNIYRRWSRYFIQLARKADGITITTYRTFSTSRRSISSNRALYRQPHTSQVATPRSCGLGCFIPFFNSICDRTAKPPHRGVRHGTPHWLSIWNFIGLRLPTELALNSRLCHSCCMKSQSKRDLEKHWAEQAKKAAKKTSRGKPIGKPQVAGGAQVRIGGQKRGS